jgi:GNAT superfamily N-acetyltransferase
MPVATAPPPHAATWTWVPIRSLAPRHRERIAKHLLALNVSDRYLRFGYPATDEQLTKYVDTLDFERDEVFGVFNRRLELIAMAHLAYPLHAAGDPPGMAEFGVSVLPRVRGRGFGRRLFEHAVLHARNRGVRSLFIHALSENTAMLKIARKAGATIQREGSESEAWLTLPEDTFASHLGEMAERQAAELNYRLKRHARQVGEFVSAIGEVKAHVADSASMAKE